MQHPCIRNKETELMMVQEIQGDWRAWWNILALAIETEPMMVQ